MCFGGKCVAPGSPEYVESQVKYTAGAIIGKNINRYIPYSDWTKVLEGLDVPLDENLFRAFSLGIRDGFGDRIYSKYLSDDYTGMDKGRNA